MRNNDQRRWQTNLIISHLKYVSHIVRMIATRNGNASLLWLPDLKAPTVISASSHPTWHKSGGCNLSHNLSPLLLYSNPVFPFSKSPMAHKCPVCPKQFASKVGLRMHTGTNDASLRHPHICHKCGSKFCSEKAMGQHSNAPSHKTMFSCDVCKRTFASRQAEAQHKDSPGHFKMLARAKLEVKLVATKLPGPKTVSSPSLW